MNLQFIGVVLIIAVIVIVLIAMRRSKGGLRPVVGLLSRVVFGANTDPVTSTVHIIMAASRVVGNQMCAPTNIALRLPAETRDIVNADLSGVHVQLVEQVNELGAAKAERGGKVWREIERLSIDYPIAVGEFDVTVSFARFERDPYATKRVTTAQRPPARTPDEAFETVAPRVVSTIEPRGLAEHLVVGLEVPNAEPVTTSFGPDAEYTGIRVGRAASSDVVLPLLPSLSADHLVITQSGQTMYVKDVSSYGSWLETAQGWMPLQRGVDTPISSGARVSLDADRFAVLSISRVHAS